VVAGGLATLSAVPRSAATSSVNTPTYVLTTNVSDSMNRTVSYGFGTADMGGTYLTTPATRFSVSSGAGHIAPVGLGGHASATLATPSPADEQFQSTFSLPSMPTRGTGVYYELEFRRQANGAAYRIQLRVAPLGVMTLSFARVSGSVETAVGGQVAVPQQASAGRTIVLQGLVAGSTTVQLQARAWLADTPAAVWQLAATDSAASRLTATGQIGVYTYTPVDSKAVTLTVAGMQGWALTLTSPPTSSSPPATSSPVPSPSPSPSPKLGVSVSGNHLVDQDGGTVQLRGANRSGTQYACAEGWGVSDGPIDDASIAAMATWHVNSVRVNGNEDCWLGINGVSPTYGGANYRAALVAFVNRINAHGMYVIFDLHHSAPGSTLALDQQPMADRDHSNAYWASVAATFKDNPAVMFDLYNEPYPDANRNTTAAWTCVRDGGTCPGVPFTAAGSQEMLDAVRGAGATNVVLVGGPRYAGDLDQWTAYKPTDPLDQLAASIHVYFNTPSDPEWAPCDYVACWNATMAPLAATTPIVIGEFGEHDCSSGLLGGTSLNPQQPALLDWADQHGISYLAWAWFTGNCAAEPALISNYSGTPTGFGAGVRSHYLTFP
jgi:endoglucanase